MNKRKIIIVAVSVILLLTGALYANSFNREAMFKAYNVYKKEVLKTERDKITAKIASIDEQLGVAVATDTGNVSK